MTETSKASPSSEVSEDEFLRQQAENAKAAMAVALNHAKEVLSDKVDPLAITRRHPIIAILTAVIGGFAAAAVAIPSKRQQQFAEIERLHRAMHPPAPGANGKEAGKTAEHSAKASIWTNILHEVVTLVKPLLVAAVTAGVKSATTPPPDAETDPRSASASVT